MLARTSVKETSAGRANQKDRQRDRREHKDDQEYFQKLLHDSHS